MRSVKKCRSCGREAISNYKTCRKCREKLTRWHDARVGLQQERRAAGLCPFCGDQPVEGMLSCALHRSWWNVVARNRSHQLKARGICVGCAQPAMPGHIMCEKHLGVLRDSRKFSDIGLSYHNDLNRNMRFGLPYKDGWRRKIRSGLQLVPVAAAYPMTIGPIQVELIDREQISSALRRVLTGMNPRLRYILESRWGIFGHPVKTLQELGDEMNLTRERVRQIEALAMERLTSKVYQDLQLTERFGKRVTIVKKCREKHPVHCPSCFWYGLRTGRVCACKGVEESCDPYTGPRGCPHNVMGPCPECGAVVEPKHPVGLAENRAAFEALRLLQRAFMKASG